MSPIEFDSNKCFDSLLPLSSLHHIFALIPFLMRKVVHSKTDILLAFYGRPTFAELEQRHDLLLEKLQIHLSHTWILNKKVISLIDDPNARTCLPFPRNKVRKHVLQCLEWNTKYTTYLFYCPSLIVLWTSLRLPNLSTIHSQMARW